MNQAKSGQEENIANAVNEFKLDMAGLVPEDPEIQKYDLKGIPTVKLGEESTALSAAYGIFDKIFLS